MTVLLTEARTNGSSPSGSFIGSKERAFLASGGTDALAEGASTAPPAALFFLARTREACPFFALPLDKTGSFELRPPTCFREKMHILDAAQDA